MKISLTLLSLIVFACSAAYAQGGKIVKSITNAERAAALISLPTKTPVSRIRPGKVRVDAPLKASDILPRVQQAATANKKILRLKTPPPVLRGGAETFIRLKPSWKGSLVLWFSPDELAAVETALCKADEFIFAPFSVGESGPAEENWNYESRFLMELNEALDARGLKLAPFKYKVLLGGKGGNYPSDIPNLIKLVSLEAYLHTHGYVYPVQTVFRDGRFLKASEMNPDEYEGRLLAKKIDHAIFTGDPQDPVIARMISLRDGLRPNEADRSPQEWLAELENWLQEHPGAFPTKNFARNGKRISPRELTEAQYREYRLRNGLDGVLARGNAEDPVVRRIIELKEKGRRQVPRKTAGEWLTALENWLAAHDNTFPRATFSQNGKQIKASGLPPEQAEEKRLADAVSYLLRKGDPQDPVIRRLEELKRQYGRAGAQAR